MSTPSTPGAPKRIIVCCDGTWMDSLGKRGSDPPSNVTRMSRVLCRTCSDGSAQIINYFPGVGTADKLDQFTGGAFGMGLHRDIREVYNFICANYVDGDAIILIGFSRGAFTARSTADMIASVGLLTPEGLDHFYTIFEDYENIGDAHRDTDRYMIPDLPEYGGQTGQAKIEWETARMHKYKLGLKDLRYTRDVYQDGVTEIKIKALGVWDTVGTLGVPPAPVIGVRGSADQWRFTNTQISNKVENAFQALALDEPRYAFRPALWERIVGNSTNLKQCWFPGTHASVGGGWYDQQMANITLAWMCDQLSTIGVEFNFTRMTSTFKDAMRYSAAHPFPYAPQSRTLIPKSISKLWKKRSGLQPWAADPVFKPSPTVTKRDAAECDGKDKHPDGTVQELWQAGARPWALGQIRYPTSTLQTMAGKTVRRPGLSLRVDSDTNEDTAEPLLHTCETIHSSVRVRLACGGLGMDDKDVWPCDSLLRGPGDLKPLWRLERAPPANDVGVMGSYKPREPDLPSGEYPASCMYPVGVEDSRWQWVYVKAPEGEGVRRIPQATVTPEEPLIGFWERCLLAMTAGDPDVWKYAQKGLQDTPVQPPA
ncbi:hypothetical protein QBC46DRAFT_398102 [Diplogelasinospora grovesii]|uniref:T6SS Phospholipase effector Tle1-like catalytic domain-containing protein n=1 Tax=Diplogelasinospora grovesii TaxID=303347 RepID=A0AAN6MX80_9PEZI|nr:hypothetical protein QBC46DRAFT_398102 [Diplogelasinospora grovesii]